MSFDYEDLMRRLSYRIADTHNNRDRAAMRDALDAIKRLLKEREGAS